MGAKLMYEFDVAIIGAGIVGLSAAAQVSNEGRKVLLLEKNETFGQETSSRNSGVIHAGFYYPEGSLKAKLCVEGNAALHELCRRYSIPFANPGKMVVARNSHEIGQLHALLEQGHRNGVPGLELLSSRKVKEMEPNVEGAAALFSATTGIMEPHTLMRFFLQQARERGAIIVYRSEVVGIDPAHQGYKVTIREPGGLTPFSTAIVVNCAGLYADRIAGLVGIDPDKADYRLHYCKGEYFRLSPSRRGLVTRLVYPVPEPQSPLLSCAYWGIPSLAAIWASRCSNALKERTSFSSPPPCMIYSSPPKNTLPSDTAISPCLSLGVCA